MDLRKVLRRLRHDDRGMTLIELLIASAISVMVIGVVTAAFVASIRLTESSKAQLAESHDAQLSAAYLPADLLSAADGGVDAASGSPTGCAGSPAEPYNVARLTWSETIGTTTTWFAASYRARLEGTEWQLVRYACSGGSNPPGTVAEVQVVARNLKPVVSAPADLPKVSDDGTRVTITVTDATGYSYAISGTRRMAITAAPTSPSPSPTPSALLPVPKAVTLVNDGNLGDIAILVEYSSPIPSACVDDFSVAGLSGRGTFAGLADISGDTARLPIVRGLNPANTAVGSLAVSVSGTGGCAVTPVVDEPPADMAAPVLTSFAAVNRPGQVEGKLETGDALEFAYSEPVVNLPALATATLEGSNNQNPDGLAVPWLFTGVPSLGSHEYVEQNNRKATMSGSVVGTGPAYIVELTVTPCTGGNCATLGQASLPGAFSYRATTTASDALGNSLSSRSLTSAVTLNLPAKAF